MRGHTDVFPASKGECTLRLTLCLPCSRSLTGAALSGALNCALLYWRMLDHLISEDPIFKPAVLAEPKDAFTPMARASTAQVQTAQVQTADFLSSFGLAEEEEMISSAEADVARAAFAAVTKAAPDMEQKERLIAVKTPAAVRHLTGMLAAYDWQFIEQATELRGYAVSKILEETTHPDAKIRLRALELLGKVTEVALFTDRVRVETSNVTDADLDSRLKEKMLKLGLITDATLITDVSDA